VETFRCEKPLAMLALEVGAYLIPSAPDAILLLETRPLARVPSAHVVPVIVSIDLVGEWLSLVEHLVRDQGVGGSNPLSPTIID